MLLYPDTFLLCNTTERDDVSVGRRPLREVQGAGIGAVFEQRADSRMASLWFLSADN
jgi:hypothetical protein